MAAVKEQRLRTSSSFGGASAGRAVGLAKAGSPTGLARFAGDMVLCKGQMGCVIAAAEPW
jgi:hypothetical protein